MNKLAFAVVLTGYLLLSNFAQAQKAEKADMLRAIEILDKANSLQQVEQSAKYFAMISEDEGIDWLPAYYAAYSNTLMSSMASNETERDGYLNDAQVYVDKAKLLSPENAEVLLVQAYIYQMRIEGNPAKKSEEYAPLVEDLFEEVGDLEPNNPRLYFLQGQNLFFGTPPPTTKEEIAASKESPASKACPMISKSVELFKTHKPESNLHPSWGAPMAAYISAVCERFNK